MKNIVQFSGGKDSTCMLLMMLEKGMQVDEIIFCDTGKEYPQTYEHIIKVGLYIREKYGKEITILKAEKDFDYWFSEHIKTTGKHKGKKGYGWATMSIRWCTSHLKVKIVNNYLATHKEPYQLFIGIAYDEPKRIHEHQYPLYDWGITEAEALEYCYSKGFDWGGLYERFERVSCWCCPLQCLDDLRALRKYYPELWQELREMDKRANGVKFKADYTVEQLEERFRLEEEDEQQRDRSGSICR